MSEIAELESRIAAALDRIREGVAPLVLPGPVVEPQEAGEDPVAKIAALEAQLDEERTVNSQLEARVGGLKERQDSMVADLRSEVDGLRATGAEAEEQLSRLQAVNAELRELIGKLRTALSENVADPDLVNAALQAEVTALEAARSADRAELDAILADLRPMLTREAV